MAAGRPTTAALGSSRPATADRTPANSITAAGPLVLDMAWVRTATASFGSSRAATTDRAATNEYKAEGSAVDMAWASRAAASPQTLAASLGSGPPATADKPPATEAK